MSKSRDYSNEGAIIHEKTVVPSFGQAESSISLFETRESSIIEENTMQETKSTTYILCLTCSVFGLQMMWSVLMSSGTPYLRSLGLSPSVTALVWMAGPLAGIIVQPIVGVYSDRCQSSFGRRRPYMVIGAVFSIISLLSLAWTKDLLSCIAAIFNMKSSESTIETATITTAVIWVYVLNIALQPLQAGIRAFIVDNCPEHQQTEANAWAGRLTGLGNVFGYLAGMITGFQWQCIIACLSLTSTLVISCFAIQEKVPTPNEVANQGHTTLLGTLFHIFRSVRGMPDVTKGVCKAQFFAWMGWFPFLYYTTSYVGNLYSQPILMRVNAVPQSPELLSIISQRAAHAGVSASFLFALVSFGVSIMSPHLVKKPSSHSEKSAKSRPYSNFNKPSLARVWTITQVLFFIFMSSTIFVRSRFLAMILVSLTGISWAIIIWIPFALISTEISQLKESRARMGLSEFETQSESQAGVMMGLHNVAIAAPQAFSALACSGIFQVLHAMGVEDSLGWILRFSAIPALIAAYFVHKLDS